MNRIIFLVMFSSFIYSQCNEYNQNNCIGDNSCEWVENIESGNCSSLSDGECNSYDGCYLQNNYPGWYDGSWTCEGGTYQIDDSYCQEIEMPECSDMLENQCDNNDGCEWIEDNENISCSIFTVENCDIENGCFLDQECEQWGSWYTWICYDYGPLYCAGSYQLDNSYCEEVSIEYEMGDINGDYIINILDVIIVVNLVLDGGYNSIVDMNHDHSIDVLDIIQLLDIILNP